MSARQPTDLLRRNEAVREFSLGDDLLLYSEVIQQALVLSHPPLRCGTCATERGRLHRHQLRDRESGRPRQREDLLRRRDGGGPAVEGAHAGSSPGAKVGSGKGSPVAETGKTIGLGFAGRQIAVHAGTPEAANAVRHRFAHFLSSDRAAPIAAFHLSPSGRSYHLQRQGRPAASRAVSGLSSARSSSRSSRSWSVRLPSFSGSTRAPSSPRGERS